MCTCSGYCPKCDPGIEAFYQQKVKRAKEAAAYLKTTGVEVHYEDLLDAKDIWYEYCALRDEERADKADDEYLNNMIWAQIEDDAERAMSELYLMAQEYKDSYAANEWGDQLWENGIDPWDEQTSKDMEIDAAIELQAMCEAADKEEAYFKREEEDAKRAKINRAKWNL